MPTLEAPSRASFARHYAAQPAKHTRPYLRVRETLRALGCDKAVATNKPGELSRAILRASASPRSSSPSSAKTTSARASPIRSSSTSCAARSARGRAQTLYVGDSLVDAETAHAAGVDLCLVTYGYAPPDAIRAAAAQYHIDRFDELIPIVAPK